jgi:hypothetical protein
MKTAGGFHPASVTILSHREGCSGFAILLIRSEEICLDRQGARRASHCIG